MTEISFDAKAQDRIYDIPITIPVSDFADPRAFNWHLRALFQSWRDCCRCIVDITPKVIGKVIEDLHRNKEVAPIESALGTKEHVCSNYTKTPFRRKYCFIFDHELEWYPKDRSNQSKGWTEKPYQTSDGADGCHGYWTSCSCVWRRKEKSIIRI